MAAPPRRRKGLILSGVIVGTVVVLGGVFGGGVALGASLGSPHFGPGMHQAQFGQFGQQRGFGGQRFDGSGNKWPGNGHGGMTGNGNNGNSGDSNDGGSNN